MTGEARAAAFLGGLRPAPATGSHRSPAAISSARQVIGMMRSGFPDVQWPLEEMIKEGDTVAARFTMRGTHDGEFFGVPASGNKVSVQAMNFYYLADGRIVGERGQPDLLGVMQQIGAVPTP
ncbi:ester cyclase [Streptomyces sp. NPDC059153]|uniref:ester cyclase n=1 Tax=Streptomyces sp. NPDC059153 TaxID=3346743 RepID=UPI0036B5A825